MNKENNCQCVVCNVEEALLDSFSTQRARNHFKALASNYPVFNHFRSPLDAVAKLHEQGEAVNHHAGNQILHAVIHAISGGGVFEDLGQQLLLVAFTPAIHKIYREICQRFPMLSPDDVAQQAWVVFLETAKSPAMLRQNGQLPVALVMNSRKAMLRWAMREARRASIVQDGFEGFSEPLSEENFEGAILLEDFLWQAQRAGLLSETEHDLLFKLKYEGFEAKALAEANGMTSAAHRRLHRRLQTIINRLQREAASQGMPKAENGCKPQMNSIQPKKMLPKAVNFSGELPFSNNEKGFSPELSHPVPQVDDNVTHVAA
jgi:DNA-directed RNA polymerase specialized sigma24 family protein